jgi:hypothetical protein
MPNHCQNLLRLTDNPEQTKKALKKFLTEVDGELIFDFDKVITMPKELQIEAMSADPSTPEGKKLKKLQDKNLENYGAKDWYDWCTQNWGTKWNSYSNHIQDNGVSFDTAWAPPIPVIVELAEKTGKDWTLLYSEPGMDFCGQLTAGKTGMYHDDQWTHKEAPKEFIDEMGITEDMMYTEEELEEMERKRKATKKIKKEVAKRGNKKHLKLQVDKDLGPLGLE